MLAAAASLAAMLAFQPEAGTVEIVREVRVHGNVVLTDAEVIAVVGVSPGDQVTPDTVATARQRLESSGRFDAIDVRKRYRSLDMTEVALVIVVHEKPGTEPGAGPPGPLARLRARVLVLPILRYNDGLGFTFGARFSTSDLLGFGERLSMPLSWGGTRQAMLEIERTFKSGPLTRVAASGGIWQRENVFYEIADRRVEIGARAERQFGRFVRAGAGVGRASVDFDELSDPLTTIGADLTFDSRNDPAYPANAVLLGVGWSALHVDRLPRAVNRFRTDARGYLRVVGQTVVAGRAQWSTSDAPLPPYERFLLGGLPTLRGFRAGSFAGDRLLVTSAEVRVPITSVIGGARLGVSGFFDAARVADHGAGLSDEPWRRSAGGGVFLIASIVKVNLDVAWAFDTDRARVHLGAGFGF